VNENVTIIVLQSEGTTFCAGASFDELLQIDNLTDGKQFFSGFANVINAIRNCSKLIVGKVQGKAVGGGVGIIAACDYAIATTKADIKLSELTIGIGPFVIEPAVSRKIGHTAMSELTLDGNEWKSATWAFEKGLFAKLVQPEDLDAALEKFASQLASYNPEALVEIKQVFWQNTAHWNTLLYERAEISGKLVLSSFTKKALEGFKK
jgi:methylglutaconyl-CoA hydratase